MLRNFIFIFLLLLVQSYAQVEILLTSNKKNYINFEPKMVRIAIKNNLASNLKLVNKPLLPWLRVDLINLDTGERIANLKKFRPSPVTIAGQQVVVLSLDLHHVYSLNRIGNYAVNVRIFHQFGESTSNRVSFHVYNGTPFFKHRFTQLSAPDTLVTYQVYRFNTGTGSRLYFTSKRSKPPYQHRVVDIGSYLSQSSPKVLVNDLNHICFLLAHNNKIWKYVVFNMQGKLLQEQFYISEKEIPRLVQNPAGQVFVAGGSIYDPAAIAKTKKNIHNITDRP